MSDQARTLPPGSVKDRQISGQAKIGHSKLASVTEAQVLVGGSNKRLSAQTVSGDATLANDGTLTLDSTKLEAKVKAVLTELDIESGSQKNITASEIKNIYEGIDGVNQFTTQYSRDLKDAGDANTGSTLVKRDGSGNIAVGTVTGDLTGTATNATDADKLDGQEGSFYKDVTNHTAQSSATSVTLPQDGSAQGLHTATTRKFPSEIYEATGAVGSNTEFKIPHNFGYYPSVQVLADIDSCGDYEEIDAFVENGTTSTTIKTSEQGLTLKFILG